MQQPLNHPTDDHNHFIIKLHKSIYGLKQAGKKWYDSLSHLLADIGFQKLEVDPAIFYTCVGLSFSQFMLTTTQLPAAWYHCKMFSRHILAPH